MKISYSTTLQYLKKKKKEEIDQTLGQEMMQRLFANLSVALLSYIKNCQITTLNFSAEAGTLPVGKENIWRWDPATFIEFTGSVTN